MPTRATIFLDFQLPNATTWFYFSMLLAVALFFKFSRFLSVRNWDVVMIFLLVPGLLLLREAQGHLRDAQTLLHGGLADADMAAATLAYGLRLRWLAYLWLICGSGYFLLRCLVDLAIVRRPVLSPNLNFGGLAWMAGALFICLVSVALRPEEGSSRTVGKTTPGLMEMQRKVQTATDDMAGFDTHNGVRCGLAILCHLAIVVGLVIIGYRHFQDVNGGMAAATFYLLLPYTGMHVAQLHHVWPIALLIWAVAAYRRPVVSGLLLGLAAGSVYFPALVFPTWLSFYRRRGAGRFAASFCLAAVLTLLVVGAFLWGKGDLGKSVRSAMALSDWQPWKKPTTEGIWLWLDGTDIHWAYRIPVFIAYLAFVITTTFWPAPKNMAHLIALTAAVLIGIQFWYADQGGVYILWYLPLLLLMVFRPNLSDRFPHPILPENDWLVRVRRHVTTFAARLFKLPEPVTRVH